MIDREGHLLAKWLNLEGVVAAVLKYRLPRIDMEAPKIPWPMQDAMRAMQMLQMHAAGWGIDSNQIGILGASAGGHLASLIATVQAGELGHSSSAWEIRPAFQILLYPVIDISDPEIANAACRVNLLGDQMGQNVLDFYSSNCRVNANTPAAFIVHAEDDRVVKIENSLRYEEALERKGIACKMVTCRTGGHGFALGANNEETARWPLECVKWLHTTISARRKLEEPHFKNSGSIHRK